jgi:hypothetical protein
MVRGVMTPEGDASMMTYNSALSGEYLNPQTFRIAHAQRVGEN